MRERRRMSYLVGILSLCLAVTGFYVGTSFAKNDGKAFAGENNKNAHWTQKHIRKVPPIMMYEPYFSEMFGQTDRDVPYNYEEAVKLAGHSCGAISGAWEITRKALEALYGDETPVRGEIRVYAPGAEDEWNVGVFGEVITYITGAAPATGFDGAEFGNGFPPPSPPLNQQGDPVYIRRDLMIYTPEHTGTKPPLMEWIFERMDWETGTVVKRVGVRYNLMMIVPKPSPPGYWQTLGARIASKDNNLTQGDIDKYIVWWNERVEFVFENADTLPGFFTVTEY